MVTGSEFQDRIERLERRLDETNVVVRRLEGRPQHPAPQHPAAPPSAPPPSAPRHTAPPAPRPRVPADWVVELPSAPASPRRERHYTVEDAGHWLAWLGGIATVLGIILFLALAVAHGWIGESARVVLAAVGSAALITGGAWLHGHRGRTEAAVAMVGAGTAGMFATLLVASAGYHLIAWPLALAGSIATGALATVLAIRWASQAIAAIGLLGALLAPALLGALGDTSAIAILAVASASAMAVIVWRDWSWLALATPVIAAPQWAVWISGGHTTAADAVVLAAFALLGLVGGVASQLKSRSDHIHPPTACLLVINGCIVGTLGEVALRNVSGAAAAEIYLAALAVVHVIIAVALRRRLTAPARTLVIALGAVLADVSFGLAASGLALTLGWAATALGCALIIRRTDRGGAEEATVGLGLGAHIALVLARALLAVPPSALGGGNDVSQLLAVATLAACCIASGLVTRRRVPPLATALNALGLVSIAYLTAATLAGDALVLAWALEAAALVQLYRRTEDPAAWFGSLAFFAGAVLHAVIVEAPPGSLITGAPALHAAAIALAAIAVTAIQIGRDDAELRRPAVALAAIMLLYLASVTIVTIFQPGPGGAPATVLDLGVRQQGQVLLSVLWSAVGLTALIGGLRRKLDPLRLAGLALLLLTAAKVFVYDLSTLTSIYRVISFVALGLLLLAGAFAHQRMRPTPPRA